MYHFTKLTQKHNKALEWFAENANNIVSWPEKLQDGTLLVTHAKGIYKPHWCKYALSIRQNLNSPYTDKDIQNLTNASWQYKYCPEIIDGKEMHELYTNKALLNNMRDDVPVGVLIQLKQKPNSLYKVLGLGLVKNWDSSLFTIESFNYND